MLAPGNEGRYSTRCQTSLARLAMAREGEPGVGCKILLRDNNPEMVKAWKEDDAFGDLKFKNLIDISLGDIFEGAPSADAIVSPANSFGFMDGGIDMAYSLHFGWQMMERLQKLLREEHDGELPVGDAVIMPAYPPAPVRSHPHISPTKNEGKPIKFLVSAPTMRIPTNVTGTVNAYLAFRAVLRAVKKHNEENPADFIGTVLCPGLGTAVGRMPYMKCAVQMRTAYEAVMFHDVPSVNSPQDLADCCHHHTYLIQVGNQSGRALKEVGEKDELYVPS